jgi:hypothetical protein
LQHGKNEHVAEGTVFCSLVLMAMLAMTLVAAVVLGSVLSTTAKFQGIKDLLKFNHPFANVPTLF